MRNEARKKAEKNEERTAITERNQTKTKQTTNNKKTKNKKQNDLRECLSNYKTAELDARRAVRYVRVCAFLMAAAVRVALSQPMLRHPRQSGCIYCNNCIARFKWHFSGHRAARGNGERAATAASRPAGQPVGMASRQRRVGSSRRVASRRKRAEKGKSVFRVLCFVFCVLCFVK